MFLVTPSFRFQQFKLALEMRLVRVCERPIIFAFSLLIVSSQVQNALLSTFPYLFLPKEQSNKKHYTLPHDDVLLHAYYSNIIHHTAHH